ncbi:hypothetical protein JCM6882_003356 [Rhodosporidiobolus microsporus]
MTAVSRPPIFTSDSCFSPLSPLGSPSSCPPTPAHLVPSKPNSAATSPVEQQQQGGEQPRNHHRTASPSRADAAPPPSSSQPSSSSSSKPTAPPQRPPRPQRLATPNTGYPFPLMLSRQNTPLPSPHPSRVPSENTLARRALMNSNDGWGTPASSSASAAPSSSEDSAPGLSSAFSDSGSSSSSPCSTPTDDVASPAASPLSFGGGGSAPAKSPLNAPAHVPPTPDDVAHSRSKHAGSTPGAPPPAPLINLQAAHPAKRTASERLVDLHDVKEDEDGESAATKWDEIEQAEEDAERTPPSLAPSPAVPQAGGKHPLANGMAGLRMSDSK